MPKTKFFKEPQQENPMDLNAILQEAQKLQHDMEQIQNKLESEEISATSDSGDVTVKITGNNKFTALTISETLKNAPIEKIQTTILSTFQKALDASHNKNQEAIKKITAGLALPTLDQIKATAQKAAKE